MTSGIDTARMRLSRSLLGVNLRDRLQSEETRSTPETKNIFDDMKNDAIYYRQYAKRMKGSMTFKNALAG
jgi:hypothetical protein